MDFDYSASSLSSTTLNVSTGLTSPFTARVKPAEASPGKRLEPVATDA
jgi:hypothetical protein